MAASGAARSSCGSTRRALRAAAGLAPPRAGACGGRGELPQGSGSGWSNLCGGAAARGTASLAGELGELRALSSLMAATEDAASAVRWPWPPASSSAGPWLRPSPNQRRSPPLLPNRAPLQSSRAATPDNVPVCSPIDDEKEIRKAPLWPVFGFHRSPWPPAYLCWQVARADAASPLSSPSWPLRALSASARGRRRSSHLCGRHRLSPLPHTATVVPRCVTRATTGLGCAHTRTMRPA